MGNAKKAKSNTKCKIKRHYVGQDDSYLAQTACGLLRLTLALTAETERSYLVTCKNCLKTLRNS